MQRKCKIHGITEHVYRDGEKRWRCKKCNVERVTQRRKDLKLKAIEYLGGKCVRCGYAKSVRALCFHHRNPEEKLFSLANKGLTRSWEIVRLELDKCDLLCANCHMEVHEEIDGR